MKMSDESKESLDLKQESSKMIGSSPMHVPIYYVNYPEDGISCLQCLHKDVCKIADLYLEGVKKIKDMSKDLPEALEVSYKCKFFVQYSTLQIKEK